MNPKNCCPENFMKPINKVQCNTDRNTKKFFTVLYIDSVKIIVTRTSFFVIKNTNCKGQVPKPFIFYWCVEHRKLHFFERTVNHSAKWFQVTFSEKIEKFNEKLYARVTIWDTNR